jgi:outer membrane receptor protein involved in Fe transport
VARSGGTPFCASGGNDSCAALWDSSFAKGVHTMTGLPVAGWGLVWGLVAFTMPLLGLLAKAEGKPFPPLVAATRFTAAGGALGVLVLAAVILADVLPLADPTDPTSAFDAPFSIVDNNSKLGWVGGIYLQDEWRVTNQLTLNFGLRFDQMWQYIDANQLSPRFNAVYKPIEGTTLHAGYARYFTPPPQAIAAPVNINAFAGTSAQPDIFQQNPVLPERSHYFDAGIVQKVGPNLQVSIDAYYKIARDLLDDGQFGAALILNGFNYEQAENKGIEVGATYKNGNFSAYSNLALASQVAKNLVSNQYLLGASELAYIANNYIYTDHAQQWTGSGGASYLWHDTRFSASMVYGSGLRSGFANTDHVAPYATANIGISHEIAVPGEKPITVRFDVVNVFDTIYELRDGSGIGVFAPQFGMRRGYFVGISK